ncbi:hypothetical protein Tco_0144025 [Tanacetum coccineum]
MVPKAVLIRSGLVSLTTTRPVNTAQPRTMNSARPMINVFNKAHSTVRRPINNKTTTKNSNFNQRVNTVKDKNVNTARPKSGSYLKCRPKAVLKAVKGNQGTCPILLNLKKLIEDMLPLEVTPKEGKSQTEFYKELEAEFLGSGVKLMGLQLLQLELRLGKIPSKSFRPVWASSSFGVSLAHDGSWSKWEPSLWLCG